MAEEMLELVRRLAGQGMLAGYARTVTAVERRRLRAGAGELVWPLVFLRVTRPVERKRGHLLCATAVQRLEPDCLDRFHDDVDAVLDDLFTHADVPIHNLEGWITSRLRRATVDAHRRRRGERGAPQRPRVPAWLATALNDDAWLVELAKAMLDWAGTDTTAGVSLWPLAAWAQLRAGRTGGRPVSEALVAADVEVVLAAMRRRRGWYDRNVERPLGRKRAPVWLPSRTAAGDLVEPRPLSLVEPHEREDALLVELAARAIDVIGHRIGLGEKPGDVVPAVLEVVFGALPAGRDLDRAPGAAGEAEQVAALIDDPQRMRGIVTAVLRILGE